jgi:hypothetical protein
MYYALFLLEYSYRHFLKKKVAYHERHTYMEHVLNRLRIINLLQDYIGMFRFTSGFKK